MANSISSSSSSSSTTINDLPQDTLIHILSFLYIEDAIRASLVSPSFRDLWHLLPSLQFDINGFFPRCDQSRQLFVDFVSQTLIYRQPNPLTKLHVKSWVRYAINLCVSELILDIGELYSRFDFHILEISKSRIKDLKLHYCNVLLPPLTNPTKFVFLKSLLLEDTLPWSRDDVCNLLARCVNLEILKFVSIGFDAEEGMVFHSSSLKELYFDFCMNINDDYNSLMDLDICCPSLQKISVEHSQIGKVINKDTTQLVEACITFPRYAQKEEYDKTWGKILSYFTNITSMDEWNDLLESNEVPAGCERFASNVKHLELPCNYGEIDLVGVAALLKLMPKLEILGLKNNFGNGYLNCDYREASTVFNMPCMKKLIMRRYRETESQGHFINLFKKDSIVLDKIELLK